MSKSFRRVAEKQRRQRAWVRVTLRRTLPRMRDRLHMKGLQAWAALMRWWAARHQAAEVRRLKRLVAKQRVDPNAPCPACGARDGEIRFAPQFGCLIHRCKVCTALFPEKPIVSWADWKVEIADEQMVEPLALIEWWQKERLKTPSITSTPQVTPTSPVKGPVQ